MAWQKDFNKLFTDSFFRFLFGFTIIIAISFGVIIGADSLLGNGTEPTQQDAATSR